MAPIAETPKSIDFHEDYLALIDFFMNEICIFKNDVVSNKQYFDQILWDSNISFQISNLTLKLNY